MKWFERNSIWVAYGFLVFCVLIQMWYITKLKSELKLFNEGEHVIIQKIKIGDKVWQGDTLRIKHNRK